MLKTVSSASGSNGFPIKLGNTTITAGSTTSSLSNLTLYNVTISSGSVVDNITTANSFVGTGSISASSNVGVFSYGNLSYSDTGIIASYASNVNSYVQIVVQNLSNANQASTDFTVVNDTGSAYGDFGITSSTFSGTGKFYGANVVYAYSGNVDMVIGTITNNAVHFVGNNATTDAMTLNGNNTITINGLGATFPNSYLSNSATTLGNATLTLGGTTSTVGNLTLTNVTISGVTGAVTQVQGNGSVNGITLTGNITSSGNITLGGTLSNVSLTSQVTGTLPVANGGTGAVSLSSGSFLVGNGTSAITTGAFGVNGNGALTITGSAGSNSQVLISTGGGTLNQWSNTLSNISISNVTINSGSINVTTTNHTATTANTATFSTSALPLVPQGYINYDLNGTIVKIPYYAV